MKAATSAILQSPESGKPLSLSSVSLQGDETWEGKLSCQDEVWPIKEGIADLVSPLELSASDARFREEYNVGSARYQEGMDWLFNAFYEDEGKVRNQMTKTLNSQGPELILDLGCGTGKDAECIINHNPQCRVILADLSIGMLAEAKKNLTAYKEQTDFLLCNGSHLPFQDSVFDRLFHFGGINEFGEKQRAIEEFNRVVKPGGKVVFGDEGVAPWLAQKEYGDILKAANPLYAHEPPLADLPAGASNVKIHWIMGNAFYLIEFEKAEGPPPLNTELTIPGKRGGTLASRYRDSKKN